MSVAKKEEVCGHPLPHLVEPASGVPIKKRPVSVPSGLPPTTKPSSPVRGVSVSASGTGCSKESFLNRSASDADAIAKGKGITNSRDQACHADRSFIPSMTEKKGVLVNGSSQMLSSGGSDKASVAPGDESQSQKSLTLDLQLASPRIGKVNYSSLLKEDKVNQDFLGFPTAEPPKDVQTSEINLFSSSFGKIHSLDLNVPLDSGDSLESLPTMHEGSNRFQTSIEHQKPRAPEVAPFSTKRGGLSQIIDSTLYLSNAHEFSNKRGAADVTLDLQLKPPARPELGIKWKGLAPAPELSLSLSGTHADKPKDMSVPDAVVKTEAVGSAKKISEEVATPVSVKTPVERIVKPMHCNPNPQMSIPSTVSGYDKQPSGSSVKKETEEPFQQLIQNNVEKAPLFEQQSVGSTINCAEFDKTSNEHQVRDKGGFDLNSGIFLNNSIHNCNVPEVATDSLPVPSDRLHDAVHTQTMPAAPEVNKFIKHEEISIATPSPVILTASGQPTPSIAKLLPSKGNAATPVVGFCASVTQPFISSSEPPGCNSDEATTDCKPTVSHVHVHEDVACNPCETKKAGDVSQSSFHPTTEASVFNSRNRSVFDGMSQGSAEMDCSDDDHHNTVSKLPTTNKPHVESLGNSQTTEAKEHGIDTHQDCSSVTNKAQMQAVDNDKLINTKDGIATHLDKEGHPSGVFVNEKFISNQLMTSCKNPLVSNTDVSVQDVKTATGFSLTDLRRSSALRTSASPKIESTRQSHKTLNNCLEKNGSPVVKSKGCQSPRERQIANCSENHPKNASVKSEHGTESEEVVRKSDLHTKDLVLGEDSHLDGASNSQPHTECTKVKSPSERSEHEKTKLDACMTSSVQNEKDGQVDESHWRDMGYPYVNVNRNERWERFMKSEQERNREHQGGRHASDMFNQRRTEHRYGGHGSGSRGHPRNFRGPRMNNESDIGFADEPIIGRRRPFEDDLGHLHRIPHRRRQSPPMNNQISGCRMRDMDLDRFSGREIPDSRLLPHDQIEDIPDDMLEERFYIPHSHPQHSQGDHAFIRRERTQRSHSPVQRRGAPMRFHRGRSPEAIRRSPPLLRTDRPYTPLRRHIRRHGSPFNRIEHDERGTQRNMRRCGVHQGVEGDAFEPPLHPSQLAELQAEAELTERRKYGDRRAYLRSLEQNPVGDEEEFSPPYLGEGDMDFAEDGSGPQELESRFRGRLEHRARGEQEDGYRYRGPQGWRDGNSNGSRPKRRRY